ncbi:COP9 signalosome complex subunit 3 [Aspergillus flavus]|uniref:COP9 signalosome complex subunit 3 n=3 Tax=Aspergillus subgen. Circumdati TaxID=2720871 RepID=A0A7U2R1J9_ASPFN|nr:COP9 signalosome complex subunit 3 [Aspergillus oryzae 3.042]KAB8240465.1 hypothetical protein BDV35DRAFT_385797 [Aspergillus flavus]KAF7624648.1 hypothetical protein AFLA_008348 [Aspergillus flavus NRRL3357]KAJ1707216.1 COP9 signalosome complex subunit 3 [Aspergillus flavus]QRD92037.1 COP9 signalosome complex subunit 3 [Aspergillus flavus]|eukprot:EIT77438.1 COP9 signalosome complex subunit 3 [Aspergillus oryzae 3.042]
MAEFLSQLTSVSSGSFDEDYDRRIRDLITYLQQPSKASELSAASGYLLDNLDPSLHTLSYLSVFLFKIQSLQGSNKSRLPEQIYPGRELWLKAIRILRSFDPFQIRYAGHEWHRLVQLVVQAAQAVSKPLLAVLAVRDAIVRLDPSSEVLTSVHTTFIKLTLVSRSYSLAVPVLERQVCHFPTVTGQAYQNYHQPLLCAEHESSTAFITDASGFSKQLAYRDHLQFFLYGAMIYMALKKWDRALHYLSIVISCPVTNAVSKIMVEGYKKWLLVSLLRNGKLAAHPDVVSSHVIRTYQSLVRPYTSLADAFEKGDYQRLKAEAGAAQSVWRLDNNTGLVHQVIKAFNKCKTLKLGRTFSALTMADVAQQASDCSSLCEVESLVASLVMSGAFSAVLLQSHNYNDTTMLRFSNPIKSLYSREQWARGKIVKEGRQLGVIAQSIYQSNHGLELSNEHFLFSQKSLRWSDNSAKSNIGTLDEAAGGVDIEEDIMGDMH